MKTRVSLERIKKYANGTKDMKKSIGLKNFSTKQKIFINQNNDKNVLFTNKVRNEAFLKTSKVSSKTNDKNVLIKEQVWDLTKEVQLLRKYKS